MELSNEFDVAAPIDQAWRVLTDLERIAPCLPGAQLLEVEGEEYRGTVKIKVGPIVAQYKGKAVFAERNDANHRAVLSAEGRDTRGQGNASATIEANLTSTDSGTHVVVDTDLKVSGKVAQFGRGVMADVSAKLMTQFVENLETMVLADEGDTPSTPAPAETATVAPPAETADEPNAAPAASTVSAPEPGPTMATSAPAEPVAPSSRPTAEPAAAPVPGVRKIDSAEAAPLDLMEVAGGKTIAKMALPLVVLLIVIVIVVVAIVR